MYPPLSQEEEDLDLDIYPCLIHTYEHEGNVAEIKVGSVLYFNTSHNIV